MSDLIKRMLSNLVLRIRIDLHHNLENGRATDDEDEQGQQHGADWRLVFVGRQLLN